MQVYFEPIKIALLTFPLIALLITFPYLLVQYRKYGSVPLLRSSIVYTFVLYLLTAYFLVILPLPSKESVVLMASRTPQLIPFQGLVDMFQNTHLIWNDLGSYFAFFKSPAVYTVLFNLCLTLPFGVYLRYYFKKKWYQVLFMTMGLSLFFELTQLTGLYGIYAKAYRLFDVDDLIVNTLGGMLGYLLTPLLTFFFPSRAKLDQTAYQKGQEVSIPRRAIAFMIDSFCYLVLFLLSSFLFSHYTSIEGLLFGCFCFYYLLLPLFSFQTIGKKVVKIKIVSTSERYPRFCLFCRQLLLYGLILPAPLWLVFAFTISSVILQIVLFFLFLSLFIIYISQFFSIIFGKRSFFYYETITRTQQKSTISSPILEATSSSTDSSQKQDNVVN